MRVLITGGGTGGHVNPALAIANTIKQNDPDAVIAYVGTKRGIENKLVPKAGYPMYYVDVKGIKRSLSPSNIKAAYLALTSPIKAKKIIREFKPDIVVGTGGYVSWPVVKAASQMGIPTALHESNAIAGVAVKMLQKSVDRIYLNFEKTGESLSCDRAKLMKVGNPILGGFSSMTREEARKKLGIPDKYKYVILSYAGSMGAEKVNDAVLCLMREFTAKHPEVYHIHATGSIELELCTSQFKEMGLDKCENIELCEYIYDMPVRMAAADITINRAGAMTISELAATGKCSIFIPSPNVAENHQYKNAKVLSDAGAAALFEEKELTDGAKPLIEEVEKLLSDEGDELRAERSEKIRQFAVSDANKLIYNDLVKLAQSGRNKK
ncbi:MAG: undecaprenyldiphospho-muramoylpentapeptide beta-N-acetylglucosaminyltransferase [Eubacteriales bacterium]|nr:undecaprenyldiphospho-muramoylpentapeptide beta-N-acetylglucosaminyltransferase [Clostridia bacterium]MDY2844703.1 undecaprenyldiphospho-muramoylpentapeptide beta-N-acetylglucosaminyltransferase [Eubacteriales bacterium]